MLVCLQFEFSYYFETGTRRRCYLAPERFYDSGPASPHPVALQPAMDVFSAGCVLAEMFLDGKLLFDRPQLLKYRNGSYSPESMLGQIEPAAMRAVILHMIQLDPDKRLSAKDYLTSWGPSLFPEYFTSFLQPFCHTLLPLSADLRLAAVQQAFPQMLHFMAPTSANTSKGQSGAGSPQREKVSSLSAEPSQEGSTGRGPSGTGLVAGTGPSSKSASAAATRPSSATTSFAAGRGAAARASMLAINDATADAMLGTPDSDLWHNDMDNLLHNVNDLMRRLDQRQAEAGSDDADQEEGDGVFFTHESAGAAEAVPPASSKYTEAQVRSQRDTAPWQQWKKGPPSGQGWQVSYEGARRASAGWAYCQVPGLKPDDVQAGAVERQPHSWAPSAGADCVWRRRTWVDHGRLDSMQAAIQTPLGAMQGTATPRDMGDSMILVAVLLCTLLRGVRMQESKIAAITLLTQAAMQCDDDTRLQRIVPYLLAMVGEPLAAVRCVALRCLGEVLEGVDSLPPSDAKIFNEYILPSLSLVPSDHEESVKVQYALVLAQLAAAANRFLLHLQQLANRQLQPDPSSPTLVRYDAELAALRSGVERVVVELVVGPKSTAATRKAILPLMDDLAAFLGRRESNDFLLPAMITFLNDRDWQLRAAFFHHICEMGSYAGSQGLQAFLLPCLEQALADVETGVIAEAVRFLTAVCRERQIRKPSLLAAARKVAPALLQHPSASVRAAAVDFVAAAAHFLAPADVYAHLLPLVMPAVTAEPAALTSQAAIVEQLPQQLQQAALDRAGLGSSASPSNALGSRQVPGSHTASDVSVSSASSLRRAGASPLAGQTSGRAGPPPSPLAPSRRGSPRHVPNQRQRRGPDEGLFRPGCPIYSLRLPADQIQQHSSHLSAAIATANAVPDRHTASSSAGVSEVMTAKLVSRASRLSSRGNADAVAASRLQGALAGEDDNPLFLGGIRVPPAEAITDAMGTAIATGLPSRPGSTGRGAVSQTPWHPQGVLVGHLAEHRQCVNQLAVAGNGMFFASASNDGTVKVWDCRKLEKDVSFKSRLTYTAQEGKITSCTACEDGQSIASGSSNGSVHLWRVEYVTPPGGMPDKYTGFQSSGGVGGGGGAVMALQNWGAVLLSAAAREGVHAWDLRAHKRAFSLPGPAYQGVLQRLACDGPDSPWLLTGTSRGHLTLWDMRFQLPLTQWDHPSGQPVEALAPAVAPVGHLGLRGGGKGSSPLVYIAAGGHEVGLWDIEEGKCHQVLRCQPENGAVSVDQLPIALTRPRHEGSVSPVDPTALSRHLGTQELQAPKVSTTGCHALLPTGAGPLLTGSSDRCIRFWDAAYPQQSYVVAGPPVVLSTTASTSQSATSSSAQQPVPYKYYQHTVQQVSIVEEMSRPTMNAVPGPHDTVPSQADRAFAQCHRDTVKCLCPLYISDQLLLSASQDGIIKAWK
ncbi:hypothetical protein ABBQ38_007667 [Trebouxia sp. C0009 RCD-2024]